MKKEILTKDIIKKEIKVKCLRSIRDIIALTILLTIYIYVMTSIASTLINDPAREKATIIFIHIVFFIGLGSYVFLFIKRLKLLLAQNIQIVTDKLVNTQEEEIVPLWFNFRINRLFYKPYCLYFARYGRYQIPNGTNRNYEWSELFCMDAKGIYNYSNIGDEFYLVIHGKKIILAYNTKLFELK